MRFSGSSSAAQHHKHHHARRLLCLTALACFVAGGTAFACTRKVAASELPLPAESLVQTADLQPAAPVQPPTDSAAENTAPAPLLTAAQAQAMLDDPRMILVSRAHKMPEDYAIETKECGSATAINKTLQTEAADAFLAMQAAAAKDGVDVRMQSGYRSAAYQKNLYDKKTRYYRDKGLSEAAAREKAATIVNPPGCSEHNCGLAADLNSPEHTALDTGFANTAAFRWLCENAAQYGFILRYPKEAEAVTGITYEPWHWRYVGAENAALLKQSGLCLEDAVALLQRIAAGESTAG